MSVITKAKVDLFICLRFIRFIENFMKTNKKIVTHNGILRTPLSGACGLAGSWKIEASSKPPLLSLSLPPLLLHGMTVAILMPAVSKSFGFYYTKYHCYS